MSKNKDKNKNIVDINEAKLKKKKEELEAGIHTVSLSDVLGGILGESIPPEVGEEMESKANKSANEQLMAMVDRIMNSTHYFPRPLLLEFLVGSTINTIRESVMYDLDKSDVMKKLYTTNYFDDNHPVSKDEVVEYVRDTLATLAELTKRTEELSDDELLEYVLTSYAATEGLQSLIAMMNNSTMDFLSEIEEFKGIQLSEDRSNALDLIEKLDKE